MLLQVDRCAVHALDHDCHMQYNINSTGNFGQEFLPSGSLQSVISEGVPKLAWMLVKWRDG